MAFSNESYYDDGNGSMSTSYDIDDDVKGGTKMMDLWLRYDAVFAA